MNKFMIGIMALLVVAVIVAGCTQSVPQPAPGTSNGAGSGDVNAAGTPPQAAGQGSSGSGATAGLTVKELDIEAYNFGFRVLNDVQINKGDTVKIVLTSSEGTHGLSMPDFNVNMGPVSPGQQQTAEFVADKSGTFDYFCNVPCGPGHSSMRTTLTVN